MFSDFCFWSLTDLPKGKQALAIHLSLTGQARQASSELVVADMKKDDCEARSTFRWGNLWLPRICIYAGLIILQLVNG